MYPVLWLRPIRKVISVFGLSERYENKAGVLFWADFRIMMVLQKSTHPIEGEHGLGDCRIWWAVLLYVVPQLLDGAWVVTSGVVGSKLSQQCSPNPTDNKPSTSADSFDAERERFCPGRVARSCILPSPCRGNNRKSMAAHDSLYHARVPCRMLSCNHIHRFGYC